MRRFAIHPPIPANPGIDTAMTTHETTETSAATFPGFFADAPTLRVYDPLAEFLGAAAGGIVEYRYVDAVRLAGHSCPTVASAYLMTLRGLRALYGEALPERGGVEAWMRDGREDGATGVTASIVTLFTGAAAETGFGGVGPAQRFRRRHLLHYGAPEEAPIAGALALRRRDSGEGVQVQCHLAIAPPDEAMKTLMPQAIGGQATREEQQSFAALWQARVRAMLIDHADDPRLLQVSPWPATA